MENITTTEAELFFPSNIPWVPVDNCICPLAKTNCYRPDLYSKPIICVHESVGDIERYLADGVGPGPNDGLFFPFFFLYLLVILVLLAQVC